MAWSPEARRASALARKRRAKGRKASRKKYRAAKKEWNRNPRVKSAKRAARTGAVLGAPVGLSGVGAAIALNRNIKKHGKIPTHPGVRRRAAKKAVRTKKKRARKAAKKR